jgi:NAD+ diphosphatase
MKSIYCPHCGQLLSSKEIGDEGLVPYCDGCHKPIFEHSPVCILTMVINEFNEVALLKQNYVTKQHLVFVAGYYKPGESAENTVKREVFEEIGQTVQELTYLESFYHERLDTLFLCYISKVKKAPFVLSSEVDDAGWYTLPIDETLLNPLGVAYRIYQRYKTL